MDKTIKREDNELGNAGHAQLRHILFLGKTPSFEKKKKLK